MLSTPVFLLSAVVSGIVWAAGFWWGIFLLAVPMFSRNVWIMLAGMVLAIFSSWHYQYSNIPTRDFEVYYNHKITLTGEWDGQYLHLEQPKQTVALAPVPKAPIGTLVVQGTLKRPEAAQNFYGFDYAHWLQQKGIYAVLAGTKVKESQKSQGIQSWFLRGLNTGLSPMHGAVMTALELGDKRDLKDFDLGEHSLKDAFTRAGVAHFLALSGQHVAILVGVLGLLISGLGLYRYALLAVLLLLYLLLVGIEPSILRAVLQGVAVLLALYFGRGKLDIVGTLALSGLISLLFFPNWLFDLGFQLSYLAVLGLTFTRDFMVKVMGGYTPVAWQENPSGWLSHYVKLAVAATICAEMTIMPLIASTFGTVPWISLLSNLVLAPFMLLLVPLGLLSGLLGVLAVPVNALLTPILSVFLGLVELFSRAEPVPWGHISLAGFAFWYLAVLAFVLWLKNRVQVGSFWVVALVAVLCTGMLPKFFPKYELVYLGVGQGDSTLIRLGDFTMLIDGGGSVGSDFDVGARTVLPALRSLGVLDLDVVVATHADTDHIEGLSSILKHMPVGVLWLGHDKKGDPVLDALLQVAQQNNIKVQVVNRGDVLKVQDATFTVLFPKGAPYSTEDNENSVAIRLERQGFKAVFLGDISTPLEEFLAVGDVDVLKVAHHGSKYSTSTAFLQETKPEIAIISVGRNSYGHPTPDVLNRLQQAQTTTYRIDEVGAIRLNLIQPFTNLSFLR